jgi:hypothetical protein
LDVAPPSREVAVDENDELARVVCSEAGVGDIIVPEHKWRERARDG